MVNCAYHSGIMVNDHAPASTAQQCLKQCNSFPNCLFWDFGDNFCRLRSNDGNGIEESSSYFCGRKECTFGTIRYFGEHLKSFE